MCWSWDQQSDPVLVIRSWFWLINRSDGCLSALWSERSSRNVTDSWACKSNTQTVQTVTTRSHFGSSFQREAGVQTGLTVSPEWHHFLCWYLHAARQTAHSWRWCWFRSSVLWYRFKLGLSLCEPSLNSSMIGWCKSGLWIWRRIGKQQGAGHTAGGGADHWVQ